MYQLFVLYYLFDLLYTSLFSVSLVFGIPTIKRERTSYLLDTLVSLLDAMSQEDKDDCVIVIFIGEVNNSKTVVQSAEITGTALLDDHGLEIKIKVIFILKNKSITRWNNNFSAITVQCLLAIGNFCSYDPNFINICKALKT